MNNIFTNKNYILIFSVMLTSSLLLNLCNQIYQCACFFVLATSMAYLLKENFGNKVALSSLATALAITFALTYNIKYNIHEQTYVGIITASILSLFTSFAISAFLFDKAQNYKFILTATLAAIIDGLIMTAYFAGKVDLTTISIILSKEVLFKANYIIIAALMINYVQTRKILAYSVIKK